MRKMPESMRKAPFTQVLGLKLEKLEPGLLRARAPIVEGLYNNYGTVHGGAIFTMVDVCMGGAVFFALAEDELCVTVEVKINYFRPAMSGELVCEARLINKSATLATAEAEVSCDGALVAKAMGTYSVQRIAEWKAKGVRGETAGDK